MACFFFTRCTPNKSTYRLYTDGCKLSSLKLRMCTVIALNISEGDDSKPQDTGNVKELTKLW